MVAKRSIAIRPVIFALALFLTGCVGYAHPSNPGYGAAYYPGYVTQPYVAPPVVVPYASRPYWYAPPPPPRHHHHHRDRDRDYKHRYRG